MIIFKKIRFKNFLSTGNTFTEYLLNAYDRMLIVGANGSGKSTLLDALSFVLYGKSFRRINKPQLVNSWTRKNCLVEVEFSIGTIEYQVRRGISPAVFEVYQDGVLLNQAAATKDYQETLEKDILGASHKSFCQVVIVGAATYQSFMRLPAAQRREVIEDLLDLQVFTAMNTSLKERQQENLLTLGRKCDESDALEDKLEIYKKHQGQLVAEKVKKRNDLRDENTLLLAEVDRSKEQMTQLKEQLEGEDALNKRVEKLWKVEQEVTYNRNRLLEEIEFLEKQEVCPTCAQLIDQNFRYRKITVKKARVLECEEGLVELKQKHWDLSDKLREFTKIKDVLNSYKTETEIAVTNINSNTRAIRKLDEELAQLVEVEDIATTEKALAALQDEINSLQEKKEMMNVAGLLLKDGGIKAQIIKQYVPIINKYINKYLSEFELSCRFELDETFNETISFSSHRDIFSYESFSQGERQGIDLSILFTWRAIAKLRNTINTNLLVLDEVFDASLDYVNVDFLLNIIQVFAMENNVIVISHKDQLNDRFDNIVKVEKYRKFSRICS